MRDIGLPAVREIDVGGDEEGICARDELARAIVESREVFRGPVGEHGWIAHELKVARLDVLRAITEGLLDFDIESVGPRADYRAVGAVAASSVEFDAEQGHRVVVVHRRLRGIAGIALSVDAQERGVRRMHKSGRSGPQRGPGIAVRVNAAEHNEWQLRIETAVLLWQMITNNARGVTSHALGDADRTLD